MATSSPARGLWMRGIWRLWTPSVRGPLPKALPGDTDSVNSARTHSLHDTTPTPAAFVTLKSYVRIINDSSYSFEVAKETLKPCSLHRRRIFLD
uniref:Uncharacterized protein n=1 Tax=Magallana gigas TaxID=29159 RepID=K1P8M8_MAGGI